MTSSNYGIPSKGIIPNADGTVTVIINEFEDPSFYLAKLNLNDGSEILW